MKLILPKAKKGLKLTIPKHCRECGKDLGLNVSYCLDCLLNGKDMNEV